MCVPAARASVNAHLFVGAYHGGADDRGWTRRGDPAVPQPVGGRAFLCAVAVSPALRRHPAHGGIPRLPPLETLGEGDPRDKVRRFLDEARTALGDAEMPGRPGR